MYHINGDCFGGEHGKMFPRGDNVTGGEAEVNIAFEGEHFLTNE